MTYFDGSIKSYSPIENAEETDNFLDLKNEDEETKFSISLNQIKEVEYV